MKYLKIFGERNTGTNYLMSLIALNLQVQLLDGGIRHKRGLLRNPFVFDILYDRLYPGHLGWKHSMPDHQRIRKFKGYDSTGLITLTKNPYSFLLSLYKRPYHYKGDLPDNFSAFIRGAWPTLHRENYWESCYENPVMLWNRKNSAYLALQEHFPSKTMNLKYEVLIDDPEDLIRHLGKFFGLERSSEVFQHKVESTKGEAMDYTAYRDYYLNEKWKAHLKPDDIAFINSFLDRQVMEYFGYQTE
jgi:hypothetical protein